jgi:hypothetical protein
VRGWTPQEPLYDPFQSLVREGNRARRDKKILHLTNETFQSLVREGDRGKQELNVLNRTKKAYFQSLMRDQDCCKV